MLNPTIDENVPPDVPDKVTLSTLPDEQIEALLYEIVALGNCVIVTLAVVENAAHPPAAILYVTV